MVKRSQDLLDPPHVPFTWQEIYRAASLLGPAPLPRSLATILRNLSRRNALWRKQGYSPNPPFDFWNELLAALAALSPDTARRVAPLIKAKWKAMKKELIHRARLTAARRAGLAPSRQKLQALVRKHRLHEVSGRPGDRWRGVIIKLPPLPKATPSMIAKADATVARAKRRWDADCRRLLRQLNEE